MDPRAAEVVIRRALGQTVEADLDEITKARAQIFLAGELVADERLDDAGLDAFMADTRALAERWNS